MSELSKGLFDSRRLVLDATLSSCRCSPPSAPSRPGGGDKSARASQWVDVAGVAAAMLPGGVRQFVRSAPYRRWDLTSHGLYTLSPATIDTLHALAERVELDVLLSSNDPLANSVKFLLNAYQAETDRLAVRYARPGSSPGRVSALKEKYNIETEGPTTRRSHRRCHRHVAGAGQAVLPVGRRAGR